MEQADWTQQVTRIGAYILTPLLIKYGVDEGSATAIVTGAAGLIAALSWWFFWNKKKA